MDVIGMIMDTAPLSGKRVRYGVFGRYGVTAIVVEVLLGIVGFDVDRGAEMTVVNVDIDVQKSDVGGGCVPGEVDGYPIPHGRSVLKHHHTGTTSLDGCPKATLPAVSPSCFGSPNT